MNSITLMHNNHIFSDIGTKLATPRGNDIILDLSQHLSDIGTKTSTARGSQGDVNMMFYCFVIVFLFIFSNRFDVNVMLYCFELLSLKQC